jgi:precorrin-6B methylase 2
VRLAVLDERVQRAYRVRIVLFLLCATFGIGALFAISEGIVALVRLNEVEQERDQWQRANEIVRALNLKSGDVVLDLGCGSGYFTLKLSPVVGSRGRVVAVDIRRLPLWVLKTRAIIGSFHNIREIEGQPDDPLLASDALDAVLVANTYHELIHPKAILNRVWKSLRRGARLVVVDQSPLKTETLSREIEVQRHELSLSLAEAEIARSGFDVVSTQDRFIDRPGEDTWWLLVAKKP